MADMRRQGKAGFWSQPSSRALVVGIVFSFVFTALIWLAGGRLETVELLPDQGASWYYWKLPEPTFWTRFTAWGGYLLHQITIWALIYIGQRRKLKYTTGLHRLNWIALAANAGFILLHFVQTHVFYDGLAQDVSIWSSQFSVIIMLIWVLLMENNRRGMFFGKKMPIRKEIVRWAREYHGYFFAWATIYTFWYHPTVSTSGHLIGFFYMFLLLLQGSLFFTRVHVNKWWTLVQEFTVLIHGTLVAVMQGNGMWPMFFFGFAGMFVITQMHGLGLSRTVRGIILALYIIGATAIYAGQPSKVWQLAAIPLIDYLGVVILALIIAAILWITRRIKGEPVETGDSSRARSATA